MSILEGVLIKNGLLTAFALIGVTMLVSYWASEKLTRGRLHGSAVAILFGLLMAVLAGGKNGVADIPMLSGVGLMGGAMLRDFAIVATAFGVRREEFVKSGVIGMASLFLGLFVSFFAGGAVAFAFGYRDPVSITTIGAGAATYIVGPVTGGALGASGEVIALSIAAGLVKAIAVMIATPFLAKLIGLNNPRAAMIFGGLMGTNSGVMAGLAATDPKLVPYGAMTATFYTGLGCLLGPSVMFMIARALF
ncbi:MAG: Malonate/sodium symporter MadM subunit [Verrucomicrobia bacterium]|nr:MAG: Malonate/sodium symporter MadM subunit [Verrucomicrobiota bacterium]